MSKELTEKFMNDELDDRLYYFTQKMSQDNVEIGHSFAFNMVRADDGEYLDWFLIHEVLAPVPTYDQVVDLTKKVHILNEANMQLENAIGSQADYFKQQIGVLETKLSEANEVIKFYANTDGLTEEEKQMSAEKYHLVYGLKAYDYLERYGVE